MNKRLIKELIKYKIGIANIVVDLLPSELSKEIKSLGNVILEGINESTQEIKESPSKTSDELRDITIE